MNPNAKTFIDRVASSGATNAKALAADVETAFRIGPAFEPKARTIRANGHLTTAGHNIEVVAALKSGPVGHLAQIRGSIAAQLDAVKAKRAAAMAPPTMTTEQRGDLVGEMQRAEVRAWLRGMEPVERIRAVLESNDPSVRDAVLLAPPALSGLNAEHHATIVQKAAQERYGAALKAWEREEDALESAAAAVEVAELDLLRVAGVERRDLGT